MIAPDVVLDPSDHLVISLTPCDEPALAFDLPGHLLVAAIVEAGPFSYVGRNLGERLEIFMPSAAPIRIQLCGRFVLELDGRRAEAALPSRQGRLLFAYLALNRDRAATRDELVEALWPYATPAAAPSALTVLVSKLRAALGTQLLCGRSDLRPEPPTRHADRRGRCPCGSPRGAIRRGPGRLEAGLGSGATRSVHRPPPPAARTRHPLAGPAGASVSTTYTTTRSRSTPPAASGSAGRSCPGQNEPPEGCSTTRRSERPATPY